MDSNSSKAPASMPVNMTRAGTGSIELPLPTTSRPLQAVEQRSLIEVTSEALIHLLAIDQLGIVFEKLNTNQLMKIISTVDRVRLMRAKVQA